MHACKLIYVKQSLPLVSELGPSRANVKVQLIFLDIHAKQLGKMDEKRGQFHIFFGVNDGYNATVLVLGLV